MIAAYRKTLDDLEVAKARRSASRAGEYAGNPVGYANRKLGVTLTGQQEVIARAIHEAPGKVKVDSGHNVGKTFLAAVLANYWYDSFDPSVVITTAPTERDVVDLLWTEIRLQRRRANLSDDFIGPAAPEMRTGEEHYAKGFTARKGEVTFQGRHRPRMFFIYDEDEGIDAQFWRATKTMFKPEEGHAWLAIGNPTTTTSQAYLEQASTDLDGNPSWRLFNLSALDHPNVVAGLRGEKPPVPSAVSLAQVRQWLADWCEPVNAGEQALTDICFPPLEFCRERDIKPQWYRPGPIGESRILGRRPTAGTHGVWSDMLWSVVESAILSIPANILPEIGIDVARKGDDFSCHHVRRGPVSLSHEAHNGWETTQNVGRAKQLAAECADMVNRERPPQAEPIKPTQIPIKVDNDGVGGGVADLLMQDGYRVIEIGAGTRPANPQGYPNKRSELWFEVAARAKVGGLSLARLPRQIRQRLKLQAMAPEWKLDSQGRRVVEPKDETKKKINRSPDDMDAMNLAYYEGGKFLAPTVHAEARPERDGSQRRPMFGR